VGRQFNFDFIVRANFVRRLRQLATDQNVSVVNQPLQARPAPALDVGSQKGVEPLAGLFGCYGETEMSILVDGRIHARQRTFLVDGANHDGSPAIACRA